ncbi:hypothetical protein MMPV_009046 [Pyropia vietnamensis]
MAASEGAVVLPTFTLAYCEEDWAARAVVALAAGSPRLAAVAAPAAADVTVRSDWGRCSLPPPADGSPTPLNVRIDMEPRPYTPNVNHPRLSTVAVPVAEGESDGGPAGAPKPPHIHIPYVLFSFPERHPSLVDPSLLVRPPSFNATAVAAKKTRLAAWASRHCADYSSGELLTRTSAVRALTAAGLPIDGLSTCDTNRTALREVSAGVPPELDDSRSQVVWWFRDYRFTVAAENAAVPGYITEKIVNSYLAETVPIYWGAPDFPAYFNADAVVMCEPGPADDWASCIDEVRTLAEDPVAYAAKLATPLLHGNTLPRWLTWEPYAEALVQALEDAGVPGGAGQVGTAFEGGTTADAGATAVDPVAGTEDGEPATVLVPTQEPVAAGE